ncbi:hypothetical protein ACFLZG_05820 [Thermodesulfobacteriota bacterium]
MNSYEEVIRKTLEIEDILCTKYNAHGKTFGEKIYSIQHKLSSQTFHKLNILLKERNNLVHQGKFNKSQFKSLASNIIHDLNGEKGFNFNKKAAVGLGIAATAAGGFIINRIMKK